ncbi:guanylate cyclase [Methylobacterium sp. Leaf456]|uniref:adenylate/guanylate cyclase domain-containing protein n=1 Tax=Methylobacterium sp. Leaf456 TaxID=1736382 RepID=UPI000700EDC4|nr:adenylate/guanylate cyclase domain-containing protein [Methylobacterium sp. Leaf456]KQT50584.1 guanylate cyclase [Methylobacterium sp. Leaf456]
MAWDITRSRARITALMGTVPKAAVTVETFDQGYLDRRRLDLQLRGRRLGQDEAPIFSVPDRRAVLVDGVHIYVTLVDYHDAMLEQGRETEAGHRRLMQFLHLHYSAADRIVADYEAQRVDFHGPRLHAVVVTPPGGGNERERVLRAIAMANALKETIETAGPRLGKAGLSTKVRIGIDTGKAVAISSGRKHEPEPLFLGRPANYAAKLAAGTMPGIFLSDNARAVVGKPRTGSLHYERAIALSDVERLRFLNESLGRPLWTQDTQPLSNRVDAAIRSLQADSVLMESLASEAVFHFHHHEPPLRTIDFGELKPSKSVRMAMMSVFADLDGFTAYVDRCIATGQIAAMVANLHVIRGELAAVVKQDFNGRKVRFIGDCVHGIVAEGSRYDTDKPASVETAVRMAGGIRSSFNLCRAMLHDIGDLGIAIGLELGATPVTRLGLRGERSVRCASSKAVSASEALQQECSGTETSLGATAAEAAHSRVRQIFRTGKVSNLDFDAVEAFLGRPASSAVAKPMAAPLARRPEPVLRAHGNG